MAPLEKGNNNGTKIRTAKGMGPFRFEPSISLNHLQSSPKDTINKAYFIQNNLLVCLNVNTVTNISKKVMERDH